MEQGSGEAKKQESGGPVTGRGEAESGVK